MIMVIIWATNAFPAPINGNHFSFQRMDDKVKDGLVLSVIGVEETLRVV